ncbi:MAG: alpha/beta fold hydrolase [Desulfobacteraceae bacterium]|jgi:alpha-beta hydrolase superfamily lysophospholipase
MKSKDVFFKSDSVLLKGRWYIPVNSENSIYRPVVLLSCGLGGKLEWFESLADNLTGEGLAVFSYDFRGHGKSEGVCDGNVAADVFSAFQVIMDRPHLDHNWIFMAGQCFGGTLSLHLSLKLKNIRGVGIFSPLYQQRIIKKPQLWDRAMKAMRDPENPHQVRLEENSFKEFYVSADLYSDLERRNIPVFLSFGEKDKYMDEDIKNNIIRRAQKKKDKIYHLKNGRHTSGYREGAIGKRLGRWIIGIIKSEKT